jgi:hypothetical protein
MRRPAFGRRNGGTDNNNESRRVLTEMDLLTKRLSIPKSPPQYTANPQVRRRVRFNVPYTGAVITYNLAASTLASQDGQDYVGSSTARYGYIQPISVKAWFGVTTAPTSGSLPVMFVYDSLSGQDFTDQVNMGVDYACVGLVSCLSARQLIQPVSNTSNIWQVAIAAQAGCTGTLTIDCEFIGR